MSFNTNAIKDKSHVPQKSCTTHVIQHKMSLRTNVIWVKYHLNKCHLAKMAIRTSVIEHKCHSAQMPF
jgi:hypothetical protein